MMGASIQVLLATYNGEAYLATQLESLLVQEFEDFEVLVSDDGSTDATVSIVRRFEAADRRVRLVETAPAPGGACGNFLSLLSCATAPYIAFCDQDDLWLPGKLGAELAEMHRLEAAHEADAPLLVFTDLAVADQDLNIISPSYLSYAGADPERHSLANLLSQNVVSGCTLLANRALYHDVLRLPPDLRGVCMHDAWFALTAAALGHIGCVDHPTLLYRQHGDNALGAASGQARDIASNLTRFAEKLLPSSTQLDTIDARLEQAAAFAETYTDLLSEEDQALCTAYAHVLERPPFTRLQWCHAHDVSNASPVMRLGLAWELLLYEQGRAHAAHEKGER